MKGYCCECRKDVDCEIVKGDVIYPHRPDLYDLGFVRCPICGNYTGIHDGEYPTLPTAHIRSCRRRAHRALDRIWRDRAKKSKYYGFMSNHFGKDFHWGMVRSDEEADEALELTIDFMSGEEDAPEPLEPTFVDLDERIKEKEEE